MYPSPPTKAVVMEQRSWKWSIPSFNRREWQSRAEQHSERDIALVLLCAVWGPDPADI